MRIVAAIRAFFAKAGQRIFPQSRGFFAVENLERVAMTDETAAPAAPAVPNMTAAYMVANTPPNPGVMAEVEAAASGAVTAVENAVTGTVAAVETVAAEAVQAVKVEAESLASMVTKFFASTNTAHLQDALLAMAAKIDGFDARIGELERFTLGK